MGTPRRRRGSPGPPSFPPPPSRPPHHRLCACSCNRGPAWLQLNTVGFIKVEDIKKLNTNASRAWFIGLLFSVALDLHKLRVNQAKQAKAASGAGDVKALQTERRGLLLDLIRDVFDLSIPGSSLEYVKIETGTVGLLGTVTSAIGIYQQWGK